ncbi:sulfotransferase family 2 domain-containing protein [Winogradskyella sp. 4-2091]|uniref:sulfotransferase family 2 domain-containing protein n=1 Tax=Winogradskyella sp. 4-2091 TaxID=3381659 RepID=UPI0038917E7D
MINHEHKIIYIHISKCAGTSVENAFGLLNQRVNIADYEHLYGWSDKDELFLQHATPQQLFDLGYLTKGVWESYYKFIIIRNPWDRLYSDYVWMLKQIKGYGSFSQFIKREGGFKKRLTLKDRYYRGDHLNSQTDYLKLNGKLIEYDKILHFEKLSFEFKELERDLNLEDGFFEAKKKVAKKKFKHYSLFYNRRRLQLIEKYFKEDITNLPYKYKQKYRYSYRKNMLFLFYHFPLKTALKKIKLKFIK